MNQMSADDRDGEGEGLIDFARYFRTLVKRKWIILAVVALGVTVSVLFTAQQTPLYQATASVVINPQAPHVFGSDVQEVVQLGAGGLLGNSEYYNTQVEILIGHDLAEETVTKNQLQNNPGLIAPDLAARLSDADKIQVATKALQDSIDAAMKPESRIVEVKVKHPDPKLAADLANIHVKTFMESNLAIRSQDTGAASKILAAELDLAEKRLRASEQAVYDFKKKNGILSISLEDKLRQQAADLDRYSAALTEARIRRIDVATLRHQVQRSAGVDVLESPIFALVGNVSIDALKNQYITEQQVFLEKRQQLGPKNPEYAELKKRVDDLHAAIERERRLATAEVEQRYAKAIATEKELAADVTRLNQEYAGLDPIINDYNNLRREQKANEENYNLVLGRLRTSELSGRNDLGNMVLHERARPPNHPVYPSMKVNVALAGVLSLLLGLGLAFFLEYLDRTVKSTADVEAIVRAPVLGLIPVVDEVPDTMTPEFLRDRDLYVWKHPKSRAAECCRSIRTNILFSGADRDLRVLTVTSPNPREGKTTSVIYLGTTMAQSGQRVLLIDTDMRRPRLHESLGVTRARGLSNLILGESSFEEAIKTTDVPNLYVLPCGPTPPNPAELLLTQRFQQLLADLRSRYDRIILDSPPLQAVADAAVLGRLSDGVILVAKAHKTNRDDLRRSARQLRDVQAQLVGIVVNSLDIKDRAYGYSNYAYGYGEAAGAIEGDA